MVRQLYKWQPIMVCHHSAKVGGHRQCGSAEIMFSVLQGKTPHACLNPPLLSLKHMPRKNVMFSTGHVRLEQQ